jgi:large subunit ribosomal protein L6
MSRIGRQPITIPAGVTVAINGNVVTATGPLGELNVTLMPGISIVQQENELRVSKDVENIDTAKSYGLMRTLVSNAVNGVATGFSKQLEVNGVGFRVALAGKTLTMSLGFSHPVVYELPQNIDGKVEKNVITISGADKQLVGQVAADIRQLKKPEPYKGKGIKYATEHIRRKAGKTATKG